MSTEQFRLDALLKLRKKEANLQQGKLNACIRRLEEQRQEMDRTNQEYNAVVTVLREEDQIGATLSELMVYRRYLERMRDLAKQQGELADSLAADLEQVRDHVIEAIQRCRAVEKLKERFVDRESERAERSEQRFVDAETSARIASVIQAESA
ncbi:MAG: flagellar export protein FliJ [Planctomycetota bacterium]